MHKGQLSGERLAFRPCTPLFEIVLQVVPLGAYFSNRHQRLLAHQSGGKAVATPALGQKEFHYFINSAVF